MPPRKKIKTDQTNRTKPRKPTDNENSARVVRESADGSETFTLFYGKGSVFSNFHPAKFKMDGIEFNCNEQYFQYKKAVQFKDNEIAQKIVDSKLPREQKMLGKKVKNFNAQIWNKMAPTVMKEGLRAKFQQNSHLKLALLASVGTTLVEASPRDRKWGIGLGKHGPKAIDRRLWRGQNLLGKILMEVRDEIAQAESTEAASSSTSV